MPQYQNAGENSQTPPRIYIVDGSGLLYRAYYAFLRQRLSHGALFGFVTTLLALIREEQTSYLAVAFDLPGPTFRNELYSDYKANREETPPELVEQFPLAQAMVKSMGITVLTKTGVEADDLIGSLARISEGSSWEVAIVSADKDFAQLIGGSICQYVPSRGNDAAQWLYDEDVVLKYGIRPDQFIDYLALIGDKSDNVPGVRGIGPKGAAKLLQTWSSLQGIYDHLDEITPPGTRNKLITSREDAFLSQDLVTIRTDLLDLDPASLKVPDPSTQSAFKAQLDQFSFRSLSTRFFGSSAPVTARAEPVQSGQTLDLFSSVQPVSRQNQSAAHPKEQPGGKEPTETGNIEIADNWGEKYKLIENLSELDRILADFQADCSDETLLAIDTETASLDARRTLLAGISFAWKTGQAYYISLNHATGPNLPLDEVRSRLNAILANPDLIKIGQNLKFDLHSLTGNGFTPCGPYYDTMVASYLCDPEVRHNLDFQVQQALDHRMVPISALIGTGRHQISMTEIDAQQAAPYACEDVDAVIRLWPGLAERLREIKAWDLFEQMEMPLLPVLTDMESRGIKLDPVILNKMGDVLGEKLALQETEIHEIAGEEFNLNSPRQLQVILFEKLKLKPGRKTKTGFSTNQDVLEDLATEHPLPAKILDYRQQTKLRGTYVLALPKLLDPDTGRLHASFHQTVTATGRLSSSNPNLQNIPIRTTMGREIRKAFVAPAGRMFLSIDYSQIELRLLAHLSEDQHLVNAFREDADIHTATAGRIFDLPEVEVTPEQRNQAKTVNFGVIYGMGAQRLARQLRIPVPQASGFIADYFTKLPGVKAYMENSVEQARTSGFAQTIRGRRRYLPDLHSPRRLERSTAERMAVNTPVQGSAADLIKLAMLRVTGKIARENLDALLLLQVHDELVFEVPEKQVDELSALIEEEMVSVLPLLVPLKVATGVGPTWYEAHA